MKRFRGVPEGSQAALVHPFIPKRLAEHLEPGEEVVLTHSKMPVEQQDLLVQDCPGHFVLDPRLWPLS